MKKVPSEPVKYALCLAAVMLVVGLRWAAAPVLNLHTPYVLLYPTVVLLSSQFGLWPGMFATTAGLIATELWLTPSQEDPALGPEQLIRAAAVLLTTAYCGFLGARLRELQRQTQARIHEVEQERDTVAAIIESFPVGIFISDQSGRLVRANALATGAWGERNPPLQSMATFQEIRGRDADTGRPVAPRDWPMARALREGITTKAKAYHIERFDGQPATILLSAAPIRDSAERILGGVACLIDVTEHQRTEEKLRESLTRLELAQEAGKVGVFEWDVPTGTMHWSPQLQRMHALEPGEFERTYDGWTRFIDPQDLSFVEQAVSRSFEKRLHELRITYRVIRNDGVLRWMTLRGIVSRNSDGKPLRILGTTVDITDLKRAEEKLRENELKLKTVIENLFEGIILIDPEVETLEWNRAALEIHGFSTPGEAFADFASFAKHFEFATLDGAVLPVSDWPISRMLRGETLRGLELSVRRRDRNWHRILNFGGIFLRDSNGNPYLATLTISDITERKNAERQIAESEANFRAVIDHLDEGVVISDLAGNAYHWNPAAIFIHESLTREEGEQHFSEHEKAFELRTPEGQVLDLEHWPLARILRGEVLRDEEIHVRRKESSWTRVFSYGGTIIRNSSGEPHLAIVTIRDITTQKLLEEDLTHAKNEADKANRAKSEFLAAMSHEIRTPLNAIMGFTDLMTHPQTTEEKRADFSKRIQRNGQVLVNLIDDILDLSKIEAGKLKVERIEMNLRETMTDVATVMRHLAEEKGISFNLEAHEPLPDTIVSDPTRFKQILTNIIGNAIKFTSQGSVCASVHAGVRELRISVQDTGIGIAPANAARLFQPFTQADPSMTRKFGGTGLGLLLSRRLAQALGGDVRLVESRLGAGSTFEICVDMGAAKFQTRYVEAYRPKDSEIIRLDGTKILVAEDMPDNQLLVEILLTMAGAQVDIAEDGREAVDKAMNCEYDVILMDIRMPRMDGFEAAAELRSRGYRGPIIALTAHAMREEVARSRAAGCNEHLAKPVRRDELLETVRRLTGR